MLITGLTLTFIKEFATGIGFTFPLLLCLATAIALLGQVAGRKEGWSWSDSLYWSFITATTVGYGDLRPKERGGKLIAVFVALLGLILSGIIVAVAVQAATLALRSVGK